MFRLEQRILGPLPGSQPKEVAKSRLGNTPGSRGTPPVARQSGTPRIEVPVWPLRPTNLPGFRCSYLLDEVDGQTVSPSKRQISGLWCKMARVRL